MPLSSSCPAVSLLHFRRLSPKNHNKFSFVLYITSQDKVATTMFMMPVIYRKFDVDTFVFRTKKNIMISIICVMLAMYLSWIPLPILIAYSLASLPFIFLIFGFFRYLQRFFRYTSTVFQI